MATCTHEIGTADTGNTPNTTGAFTPVLGDLLIGFVIATDTTDAAGTFSNSAGTIFTLVTKAVYAASAHAIYCFVANSLVSSATSQTCTWTHSSDTGSGTVIFVCAVAGMAKTGTSAIRQFKGGSNAGAGTTLIQFDSVCITTNPTLGVIGNSTSPAGLTPPTGWTEPASTGDLGYSTPTTGGEYCFRDSGFTGISMQWSDSASNYGGIIIELDASVNVIRQFALLGVG